MKRLLLIPLIVMSLACSEDEEECAPGPVPVVPVVECCDFADRHDCREFREGLLAKPGFIRKLDICFDKHGRCFTGCP